MRLEHWRYTIPLRLRSLFRRNAVEQELEEELQIHLEQQISREIAAGKSPAQARNAALRALGGLAQQKEECRDMRRVNLIDHLLRDLRFGFRALLKSPSFTAIAVLTLTLGIGANTAVFSVVDTVLLRPLPYPHPDQLVRVYESNTSLTDNRDSVSPPNFVDWRAQARSFSALCALRGDSLTLTGDGVPESVSAQRATEGTLEMLGVQPAVGRSFSPEDYSAGRDHVVLLTHEFWAKRYAANPSVVGQQLRLNFEPYTIVGILPAGFRSPSQFGSSLPLDLVLPLTFNNSALTDRGNHYLQVFGRLNPGVTPAQAQSEMTRIAQNLAQSYPNQRGRSARVFVLPNEVLGSYRNSLLVILSAAGLILLISCANLANALLARGLGQQHEIAVRFALGAGRLAIVRQILIQNLILAAAGCVTGIISAFWLVRVLHALAPAKLPRIDEVAVDGASLAFAVAVSLCTGLAFGLIPAFQLSGARPYDAMKGRGTAGARSNVLRWRNTLVIVQVMLSVVLLVGAGLLLKSFAVLRGIDMGFQSSRIVAMRIALTRTKYPNQAQRLQFFARLADRVRALPGVEAVGYTNQLPMRGGWGGSFQVESPEVPMGPNDDSDFQIVNAGYFAALRIKLLRGRLFDDHDTSASDPVILVNRTFARRYWPHADPIGQLVHKGSSPSYRIVGVVEDVHLDGPASPPNIEIYFAAGQAQSLPTSPGDLAVRAAADPLALVNAIQREVWALDKDQPVTAVRTLDEVVAQSTSGARFNLLLLGLFAALALILAAIGIYGVVSYSIAQRAPEIGIRIAIGASSSDVLRLVLRQIVLLIAIGALLGVTASVALSRYVASMLFGVAPRDPATLAIAIVGLALVGLLAACVPARRALHIDPITVLRVD